MIWDDVRVFLAVARTGQLQAASKQLGMDRTTVGRRLAALESTLGLRLFHRTRDGLTLTPAGERTVASAERMESASTAITRELAPSRGVSGVVKLAMTDALAPFVVEAGLLSLLDEHPTLSIEILAGNRRLDLVRGEADLALRVDPLRGADLKARSIARGRIGLFASAGYLSAHGTPKTVRQLAGHRVLAPSGELVHLPEARWLAARPELVVAASSNSLPALVSAARVGRGLVPLVSFWGEREPGLAHVIDLPAVPPRTLWLVTSVAASERPACRVVLDRLARLFRDRS